MDNLANGADAALVIVAFLQADCVCRDCSYSHEIISLCSDITAGWNINLHKHNTDTHREYEEIESDGHLSESVQLSLDDIQPLAELPRLAGGHAEEAVDYHAVAQGLRDIAAQFEQNLVARATQNLRTNISSSPSDQWKNCLQHEVDWLLRQGMALEHLPQERVLIALSLTLVKGVCIQAPQLIRSLFTTVHQLVCRAGAR